MFPQENNMGIALYDAAVLGFIQTVQAMEGVLQRGLAHFKERGVDANEIVETRLHPDMLPFRFQVYSIVKNSVGAIENAKAGLFPRPPDVPALDYAGLQAALGDASAKLKAYSREEVNALQGRDMLFHPGEHKMVFTIEDFLMSFSIPNFHFHATTAYDILRSKGVPIGKRDYLGRIRVKGSA
jgi:hypothetical protein